MKDLELAENMIANLDAHKEQPDWQETMDTFKPMIERIMEEDQCNAMKASIPILKKFKENDDQYGAGLLMAIVTDMMLEAVKN